MRNSFFLTTALASGVAMTGAAKAQDIYLRAFGGLQIDGAVEFEYRETIDYLAGPIVSNSYSEDFDVENGFVVGGALGVKFGDAFIDAEIAHRDIGYLTLYSSPGYSITADSDTAVNSFMINAAYEIPVADQLGLYALAGVGAARLDSDQLDEETAFAFQLGVGINVYLTENVSIGGGYRYFRADDLVEYAETFSYTNADVIRGGYIDYTESSFIIEAKFGF